jgi:putative DNA primase/helicase
MSAAETLSLTDLEQTHHHLHMLWDGADPSILGLAEFPDDAPEQLFWFSSDKLHDAAGALVRAADAGRTVYASMGLRTARPGSGRGDAATISAIAGPWADIDYRGPGHKHANLPPSREAALALIDEALPLRPTLIIDSGGGVDPLWLLKEPWHFENPDEQRRAEALLDRTHLALKYAAQAHGWHIDNVSDLARIRRVAGTINWKIPGDPRPVSILRDNGPRYTLDELEELLPDLPEAAQGSRSDVPHVSESKERLTDEERKLLITGMRDAWGDGVRHNCALYFGGYCWNASINEADALQMTEELSRNDRKPGDRQKTVLDTYARGRDGKRVSGYYGLRDTVGVSSENLVILEQARERFRCRVEPKNDAATQQASASPEQPHLTDLGNAKRLVARHGEDLRYCQERGAWFVWDGQRWTVDQSGEIVRRAKDTILAMYVEAGDLPEAARKALVKHALSSEAASRIKAMISLAESELGVPVLLDDLDRDPMVLNVQNGTIDLRTGDLQPHDRRDLITRLVPIDYDPLANCPTWHTFLDRVLSGKTELIEFIQRAAGYSLTGNTSERCFFLLYGMGRNGKSTLVETLQDVMADLGATTPTETLLATRDGSIPNDIAALKGVRFVAASEIGEGRKLAEAKIKALTGGDTISARFMRGEFFNFRPVFKLWISTNHKPKITETTDAIWDRIRLIPFSVRIPKDQQDPQLRDKLRMELPGILTWAVEGCLAWQREGLKDPVEVLAATSAYRQESDLLGAFIDDLCVLEENVQSPAKALYAAYTQWCEDSGERAITQTAFGKTLAERGFDTARVGKERTRYWLGIGLKGGAE